MQINSSRKNDKQKSSPFHTAMHARIKIPKQKFQHVQNSMHQCVHILIIVCTQSSPENPNKCIHTSPRRRHNFKVLKTTTRHLTQTIFHARCQNFLLRLNGSFSLTFR